jgi:hypothetical protein
MDNSAPILLIVFNRPDTTQKVFDSIRNAKPRTLYIASDAPRVGKLEDEKNCALVKEIITNVDWDCKVRYRYAEINQGCGPGPFNAISWAFENEDRLIILEDDCVPALSFFPFCDELLERYKNDTRIWLISGNQYNEEAVKTPHSYFFSKYGHSWGWATWKRCWAEMDMTMSKYQLIIEQDLFKAAYRTKNEAIFFQNKISRINDNEVIKRQIWDFQFGFAISSNGGLCIVPKKNLVTNIGYLGTHSENKEHFHDRAVDTDFKILTHPDFILCDVNYDAYHFDHHWNIKIKSNIYKRIKLVIRRYIKTIIRTIK